MKILKEVVKLIIGIPNIPFVFIFAIYIAFTIYKREGVDTFKSKESKDLVNGEVKSYVEATYTKDISITISVLFYLSIFMGFVLK